MSTEHLNILNNFIEAARQNPAKDALLYYKSDVYWSETYLSIYQKSLAFVQELRLRGVGRGDRVAVLMENRPEFSWVCFGVFACGGIIVPLDVQYTSDTVSKLVEHAGVKVVVSMEKFFAEHGDGIKAKWICIDSLDMTSNLKKVGQKIQLNLDIPPEEIAAFFYTSGTTSSPKAVMLSHQNLLANVDSIRRAGLVRKDDVVISMLPLHHTFSFTVTLLCPLLTGMTIAYPKSLASVDLMACIKQTCTTLFVGVPQVFAMIHRSVKEQIAKMSPGMRSVIKVAGQVNFAARKWGRINVGGVVFKKIHQQFGSSLRVMVSGGARLDPGIARDFYQWGFNLVEGYGLTETSPVVSFSLAAKPRFGSVGRPLPGVEVCIEGADEKGEGEVLVLGLNVMKGYYRSKDETDKVIHHGWFHTGDIGRVDADGFLYLTGRKKEMLVLSNGENINPEEIESYYGENNFIKEVAILTVRNLNKSVDLTRLVAIIVPDEEWFHTQKELHIRKRLRWELENYSSKLPTYKRIRGFVISQEDLPRTRLGKLKRFEFDKIYHQLQEGGDKIKQMQQEGVHSDFSCEIIRFIEKYVGRPSVLDDHLELDLGLDSLGRVEFFIALQKHLDVLLTEKESEELFECITVGQLLGKLKEVLKKYGKNVGNVEGYRQGFSATAKSALTYLEEQVGRDVSLNDHLELDLGMDSLSRMELLLGIQQSLGLSLTEDDAVCFFMCNRVGDLLDELNRVVGDSSEHHAGAIDWHDVLFQGPDVKDRSEVRVRELNMFEKLFSGIMFGFLSLLFKLCFRIDASGMENLPEKGPYILCANHSSYFDALFIFASMPFRIVIQTFFLGDSRFLNYWIIRPFKKIGRLIPIEFTHRIIGAMKLCAYVLRNDKVLCYFPEGQRSIDGEVKEFRKGIGVLIHELDVPVVPIYIDGAFYIWPRGRRWPRFGKVSVKFGRPVSSEDLMFKMVDSDDMYTRISKNLRENIVHLSGK